MYAVCTDQIYTPSFSYTHTYEIVQKIDHIFKSKVWSHETIKKKL